MSENATLERRQPTQERSRERCDRILEAAKKLVAEAGTTEGVTTRRIAEQAGVPIGSVYYLFPNSKAIFYALFSQYLAEAQTAGRAPEDRRPADWAERIDDSIDRIMGYFWSNPLVSVLWRSLKNDPELQEVNEADNARWQTSNFRFLKETLPHLGDDRLRVMARVFVRISEALLNESQLTGDPVRRELIAEELKCNLKAHAKYHLEEGVKQTDDKEGDRHEQ